MIRAVFRGGPARFQGVYLMGRAPELLILTMGFEHHIYQRVIDPDTGKFLDVYEFHSTRSATDEEIWVDELG